MKVIETGSSPAGRNGLLSAGFIRKSWKLILGGGTVFWMVTIATSLLPVAAEYRAAFSNWRIQTVWADSLPAGLLISCFVSCFLLRFTERNPARDPRLVSVSLSMIALAAVTVLIDVPRSFAGPGAAPRFFFIGILFNTARFVSLGTMIGCLYKTPVSSVPPCPDGSGIGKDE
jgi:hypothetical protein